LTYGIKKAGFANPAQFHTQIFLLIKIPHGIQKLINEKTLLIVIAKL